MRIPFTAVALALGRLSLRYWCAHPVRSIILLFIFALGVGTYLSISMATRTALTSFAGFTEALTGQSDWVVRSESGFVPESALLELRAALGEEPLHIIPVVETTVTLPAEEGAAAYGRHSFPLVGLDLIALQNLPNSGGALAYNEEEPTRFDLSDTTVGLYLAEALGERFNVVTGDALELLVKDELFTFKVLGILQSSDAELGIPDDLMLMDLPALQRLLGIQGKLNRIELLLPPGSHEQIRLERIQSRLEQLEASDWEVVETTQARQSSMTMTQAFRLNLQVLALISLLVSIYLITQAMDASVVRRRKEIGILRSLGFSEKMILSGWLVEIFLFGLIGSVFGILLGWGLAQFVVQAISQTVNALYTTSVAHTVELTRVDVYIGLALGLVCSLVTGLLPAYDATSTPPVQVLRRGNEASGLRIFEHPGKALILIFIGVFLCYLPPIHLSGGSRFPLAGYMSAICWILGGTVVVGALFQPLGRLMRLLGKENAIWSLACARFRKATSRHKLAVSGLFISIAMAGGMNILISSFAETMHAWIAVRFKADLYIASEGAQSAAALNQLSEDKWSQIVAMPEVETADLFQVFPISLNGVRTFLAGARLDLLQERDLITWVDKPAAGEFKEKEDAVPSLVNETFVERFGLDVGTFVEVPTFSGVQRVWIAGVYADYGNEQGALVVERETLSAWFASNDITNMSIFLKENTDVDALISRLKTDFPGLSFRTNKSLKKSILDIFNQTFAVTHAIKWIGVFVALVGLGLALVSIIWESKGTLRVMHHLGMPEKAIAQAMAIEGLVITLVGVVGGLILSIPLGALLVFVINKQSFGWTLQYVVPGGALGMLCLGVIALGGITAYAVGLRTVRDRRLLRGE